MVQLGVQERERHAEEISRLEHEVAEASDHLKQCLAANSELSKKMAREMAEKELAKQEAAEVSRRLAAVEADMARVVAENTELTKMVEERDDKLSSSMNELATIKAIRDEVEAELDHNFDHTEELLKQSFLCAVRQIHVLYGGHRPLVPSTSTTKCTRVGSCPLPRQEAGSTEGKEDKDNQD